MFVCVCVSSVSVFGVRLFSVELYIHVSAADLLSLTPHEAVC